MAQLVSMTIAVDGQAAMLASIRALSSAIHRLVDERVRRFDVLLAALHQSRDLFFVEPPRRSARGTPILDVLKFKPTDRYRELVAAVAVECDDVPVQVIHGWPILSDVSPDSLSKLTVESIPLQKA